MQLINTITNERLCYERLDNGLRVYLMCKPGFLKKYAMFASQYGSIDSQFKVEGKLIRVPDGIAHFLEHKLFEEDGESVFERFARFGANVNAFTSYTMTTYLFSTTDYFQEALLELLRFVQTPYLTVENVEKEKGIIEQELKMYDDHPDRRVYNNLLQALYHQHPIKLDIGGTVQSIQQITIDQLETCYNLFYQPSNMALFIIGDIEVNEVLDLVKKQTDNWKFQQLKFERVYPHESASVTQHRIEAKLNISQPRYYLGIKDRPQGSDKAFLKQQFAMNIIWRMLAAKSSPVYERFYDANLIDDSFGASFQAAPQYAFSLVGGETEKPDQLDEALRQAIKTLQRKDIAVADFERIKRRTLGSYLASFNSLEYIANSFIAHLFNGTNFLDIPDVLHELTVNDVNEYLHEGLDLDNSAVSLLMPE